MFAHQHALVAIDLAGIFVFAITGALVAVRKHLDVFGVLVLAGTTGLGGGFLRDVLIGATPPAALAFFFHPTLGRMERTINGLDAAGLGLFCITGAVKALDYGLGPIPAALMGMVTGVGGGMIRDVLAGRVPVIFSEELYATPALAGAFWAVLTTRAGWPTWAVVIPAFVICFGWRILALRRNWRAPLPGGPASV